MRCKALYLLGLVVAGLILSGCAGITYLAKLPPEYSGYFAQKAESSLSKTSHIEEMTYVRWNGFQANITIKANPETAESDCRNLIHAMSRDPNFPAVDIVSVCAKCSAGTVEVRDALPVYSMETSKGFTVTGPQLYAPPRMEEKIVTVFGCYIKKDALLRGEEPIVDIRNGVYVSGNLKGEKAD